MIVIKGGRRLKTAKGKVKVRVACEHAACNAKVKLVGIVKARVKRKGKTITRQERIPLGKARYAIAAGKRQTLALALTKHARRLLAKLARHHKVAGKLIVTVRHGERRTKRVKIVRAGRSPAICSNGPGTSASATRSARCNHAASRARLGG